jgi:hypothetical protein
MACNGLTLTVAGAGIFAGIDKNDPVGSGQMTGQLGREAVYRPSGHLGQIHRSDRRCNLWPNGIIATVTAAVANDQDLRRYRHS